jgi:hypothetical protein
MAQVVNAHAVEFRRPQDRSPRLVQIRARRAFACTSDDMRIAFDAWY